jgi:ATP-dependent protease ClpP protease subunit
MKISPKFFLAIIATTIGLVVYGLVLNYNRSNSLVTVAKDYVFYDGPITPSGANELIEKLQKNNRKHFYINSPGGSGEAGLEIGKYVSANEVAVTVIGECHSSCANYIFLPSKKRSAAPNAQMVIPPKIHRL